MKLYTTQNGGEIRGFGGFNLGEEKDDPGVPSFNAGEKLYMLIPGL